MMLPSRRNKFSAWAALGLGLAFLGSLPVCSMAQDAPASPARTSAAQSSNERAPAERISFEHRLVLYNTHTGERLDIIFRRGDEYVPASIAKLDYFLRDHWTGEVRHFDPRLYDILDELTAAVGHPHGEIDIVCGYRSAASNASLRDRTAGVAKNSLHIQAQAIDLRMPGVSTVALRQAALSLRRGGVGYYPHSDFIHVDTGRVRQWCFDCAAGESSGD